MTDTIQLNDIFTLADYDVYRSWAVENGYTIQELEPDNDIRRFQIVEIQQPILTYAEKRANEYPSFGDQLDMIYWDKVNGTNLWQEKITEIKNKYPKE